MTTSQAWPVDYDPFAGQIPQRLNSFAVPVGYDPFQINDPSAPPERPIYSTNLDPSMHSFSPLPQGDPNAVPVGRAPDPEYLSVGPQGRPMTPQGLPAPLAAIRNLAGDAVQGAAGSAWQAATLPGRYLEGERIDPVAEGLNFAGAVTLPSLGRSAMVGAPARDVLSMSGATQGGERIVSAAVKVPDGSMFTGPSHVEAAMKAEGAGHAISRITESDGFVTSTGRYVDRKEALAIAEKQGQIGNRSMSDERGLMAHQIFDENDKPYKLLPVEGDPFAAQ